MFTTGSKLLIGSAAVAWIAAAAYGIAQEGALGTIGLVSVAIALSFFAALEIFVRDANVSATDAESFEVAPAAQVSARPSLWPLFVALGVTAIGVGLATEPAVFVVGVIVIAAGTVEWMFSSWSERASADPAYNEQVRGTMADPLALPIAGAIGFAVVVYSISRVMLGMPSKEATVVVFAVVGSLALAIGVLVALRRGTSTAIVTGVFSIAAVAIIAGGAVAGFAGERDIDPHETTAELAHHDNCGVEETHADERGSQNVAAKSNVAAELVFDGAALDIEAEGFDDMFDSLTLPRSNPSNILFHNESSDAARLVIDLHPAVDADGEPVGPERLCTTLVDEGGTQFLTVEFDRPSFVLEAEGNGYEFKVPGTDAAVEVVVP